MKYPLTAALLAAGAAAADTPVLTVYTYDSFVAEWGPGPQIEAAFEETCACDLQLIAAGDGAAVLSRLLLEGDRTEADLVLGLDTALTARAAESGLFAPHGRAVPDLSLPVAWTDDIFLPYDWGYFAFVYDETRLATVPASFEAMIAQDDLSVVIQDPRSSTPGLGLLLWIKSAYGDRAAEVWAGLSPKIVTVTPGWSEAYGLFLDGEADMVLSYTTSPAYHLIAEEDATKRAAIFDEGHYMQIEVAGKLASTDQPDLADAFLDFMLSPAFQSVIPTTNWMYPAAMPLSDLPDAFAAPIPAEDALLLSPETVEALRDEALAEWLAALAG